MNLRRPLWPHVASVLLVIAMGGCQYVKAPALVPVALPPEVLDVALPPEAFDQVGVWAFQVWLKTAKVSGDVRDEQLINGLAAPIIESAKQTKYAKVAEQLKWEIRVVENDTPNAYGFPGGKIAVNKGLLNFTNRNRDMLAVAVAHEVVHALARHAGERMNAELKQGLVMAVTGGQLRKEGLSPEATAGVMVAIGISWEGGVMVPFSRAHESEADSEGLLLMARGGFNPGAALTFWEVMNKRATGSRAWDFVGMHPTEETRIKQLKAWIPEAVKIYHARSWGKQ